MSSIILPKHLVYTKVAPHLFLREVICPCGCGYSFVHVEEIKRFELLRVDCGFPLPVTSGCRCLDHNNTLSHRSRERISEHVFGCGLDIVVKKMYSYPLEEKAKKYFNRIGRDEFKRMGELWVMIHVGVGDIVLGKSYPVAKWGYPK